MFIYLKKKIAINRGYKSHHNIFSVNHYTINNLIFDCANYFRQKIVLWEPSLHVLLQICSWISKCNVLSRCCQKGFSLFQLFMCLTLLEKSKIATINSKMTIEAMIIVNKCLRFFSIPLPENSMFAFIVIESVSKFSFGFSKIKRLTTHFTI